MTAADKLAEIVDRHFALISAELTAAVEQAVVAFPKMRAVLAELTAALDEWRAEQARPK